MRTIGVNTWVWTSPLTDENAPGLLRHIADLGFEAVELPLENPGDLTADVLRPLLTETGLRPYLVGAMAPGRDLVATDVETVRRTQGYLRACIDLAEQIGAPAVCGPFYASTGRVWRIGELERHRLYRQLRESLEPIADYGAERGVRIGIEPLNRYETSVITTVAQAIEALEPLFTRGVGLALDTYHLNIEERSSAGAIRAAGQNLVHLQVCGNDRGAPGGDQTDWSAIWAALDEVGYTGALCLESFTAENAAIATAASIWRPLAPTQDDLARDGLAAMRRWRILEEETP